MNKQVKMKRNGDRGASEFEKDLLKSIPQCFVLPSSLCCALSGNDGFPTCVGTETQPRPLS